MTVDLATEKLTAFELPPTLKPESIALNHVTVYSKNSPDQSMVLEELDGGMTVINSLVSIPLAAPVEEVLSEVVFLKV